MTSTSPAVSIEALLAHKAWVRSLAVRLADDPAAADDLEQETWLEALRHPPGDDRNLRGWFSRVTRSVSRKSARSGARRSRRERASARHEAQPSTAGVVVEAETQRDVVNAVLALDEPYRRTLLLRFYEGLPPRDVSARMGVPVETVRTRTRRALAILRATLKSSYGHDWRLALLPLVSMPGAGTAATGLSSGSTTSGLSAQGAAMSSSTLIAGGVALLLVAGIAISVVASGDPNSAARPAAPPAVAELDDVTNAELRELPDGDMYADHDETPSDTDEGHERPDADVQQPDDGSVEKPKSVPGAPIVGVGTGASPGLPPPVMPVAPGPVAKKANQGKTVSLDVNNMKLDQVIGLLVAESGADIQLSAEAQTEAESIPVTLSLKDVSLKSALQVLARISGLTYSESEGVHLID